MAATILIAVDDGVLADSLRFSLELEGFGVALCNEHSLRGSTAQTDAADCLVLDNDVFVRMLKSKGESRLAGLGYPVILMVGDKTEKVLARAKLAGVATVVEEPLVGGVLLEAINARLRTPGRTRRIRQNLAHPSRFAAQLRNFP